MTRRTAYWRQIFAALAVIALLILPFGHAPLSAHDTGAGATVAHHQAANAGSPGQPDEGAGHTTCHACRIGGVALPPPPYPLEPTHNGSSEVLYAAAAETPVRDEAPSPHNPRAPPIPV